MHVFQRLPVFFRAYFSTCRVYKLGLSVILFPCAAAFAQHNPEWSSIDLRIARADRVVIGHIASMGEASSSHQQSIVLAVDDTLKGQPVSQLPLTIGYDLWRQLDREKILCSACAPHSHRLLVTIRPMQSYADSVTDLDSASVFDVAGDLRMLPTGAAILQAAREEVRRSPGVLDSKYFFSWGPTETFMPDTPFHRWTVYVPVDERQEKLAHQMLTSERPPAEVVGPYANDRTNAVLVLAFFRSAENLQLLKSLLNDPQIEHAAIGQLDYPIRAAAYSVLSRWGVDVSKPVTLVKIQEPWNGKMPG
jgi:hypothetical protein